MAFNAPIMAISSRQPNSPHSIKEAPGLLLSIYTQRYTTFGTTGPPHPDTTIYILTLRLPAASGLLGSTPSSPPPSQSLT